ncbi:hypothetical protein [Kribbella monticola]|uniref:hypothetical protein n=1 Tax=Kribbella monticola TaxID=2185285 RepID=UPI000DD49E4D|nr:hypothetical protein [Kribbella monticola]
MRSPAMTLAGVVTAILLLAGCGGSEKNNGTLPVGVGDDSEPTVTLSSPAPRTSEPSTPRTPTRTGAPPRTAKLTVVTGNYGSVPAVQGLVAKYPLYFQAMAEGNSDLIKANFPAFFYADTAINVETAKSNGWVLRPPASIVVMGAKQQPNGVVRVSLCRSQTAQYWNPKTKRWVVTAPHGAPQAIDMVRTGAGWTMYQMAKPMPKGIDCSKVRYPA